MKQASFNWFEMLKNALISREFTFSRIHPCLYLKDGIIVLTYVDDCIIVCNSIKDINNFIDSLKHGPKHGNKTNFDVTDKGDIEKFLGIKITDRGNSDFELSQPFLIDRIIKFLSLKLLGEEIQSRNCMPAAPEILNKSFLANHARRNGSTEQQWE